MRLLRLWLSDFRCYEELDLSLPAGFTVVEGDNGQGKTSLLEAIAWIATARSFRGVPDAALVRNGASGAVVRAELERGGRQQLVEAEIKPAGRNRILVNRQQLPRLRELADALRVTVFSPDDLELVKGGPGERRRYLDELLAASAPRYEVARADFERVLRHRNALLRSGVRSDEERDTLAVFDDQLVRAGGEVVRGRLRLAARLAPVVASAYQSLAADDLRVEAAYVAEWAEGPVGPEMADGVDDRLRDALRSRRRQEIERGVTLVGPHRDDWFLRVHGLDARTHASQGEQRTLALALRLGGHQVCAEVIGEEPVLLLDDVFSELDPQRAGALMAELPPGQTVLTTAGIVPAGVHPERRLRVSGGQLDERRREGDR
jgi:DNA replication and repair protein RecF